MRWQHVSLSTKNCACPDYVLAEMIGDAVDGALDTDEVEEETDGLVGQVLDEIGIDLASTMQVRLWISVRVCISVLACSGGRGRWGRCWTRSASTWLPACRCACVLAWMRVCALKMRGLGGSCCTPLCPHARVRGGSATTTRAVRAF